MSRNRRRGRTSGAAVLVALLLLLSAGCTTGGGPVATAAAEPDGYLGGVTVPQPYVMPDVSLTDTNGRDYNLASSPSKPVTLLFFGYTHCPDVCIAVLSDVALSLQRMEPEDRDQIQVVFVTTDPARDHAAQVKAYLARFDPDFVGLTGGLAQIKDVAGQVGVDIEGMEKLPSGGYEVGHSAQVIGFDRERGVVLWTPGTPIKQLKHDFTLLVDRSR